MSSGAVGLAPSDRNELHDLVIEHAWLLDHNQWHGVADLYADDGTMSFGTHTLNGRSDLLAWADQRAAAGGRRTHHQCTNIRQHGDGANAASGTVMLVLHVSENGAAPVIEFVGEYRDRYQRDGQGRWRFLQRQLQPLSGAAVQSATDDD